MPGLSNNQYKTQRNYRAVSYRVQCMVTTSIRYLWTTLVAVDTMSPLWASAPAGSSVRLICQLSVWFAEWSRLWSRCSF